MKSLSRDAVITSPDSGNVRREYISSDKESLFFSR